MTNKHLKQKFHFLILALLLLPATLQAQELSVKSFTEKTNDLSASTQPRVDNNGVPCALVKVQIASQGVRFEGNVMGDVAYKTSEYWVYMPKGSKRLSVKLEGYLPLNVEFENYGINALESKLTYLLVISGVIANAQQQEAPKQQMGWLIINSTPDDADVYLKINGVESLEGKTPFQKKLAYGSYDYRLKKNLYHDEAGVANVNSSRVEKSATLRPAHGRIKITSNPSGANVVIEGERESYSTPCTTDVLPSGQYKITLSKAKYTTVSKTVSVSDGAVTPIHVDLAANFAQVTVNSLSGAEIYLNGSKMGNTSYSAELTPGVYDLEARLSCHRTSKRQIEVEANKPQTITLTPTPIYGSLDVISEPMNATVTINGKNYGQTPTTIDNLLIGSYQVTLTKDGYGSETASVTIEEGKTAEVNRKLSNGKQLTFTSTPSGAELYVDGKRNGTTPATLNLTYGNHSIKVKNSEAEVTDNIQVSATMSQTRYSYELNAKEQTFTVKGVSFTMVKVDGGTFTMGATSEQGSDAESDEKPTHRVTLSSYSIGQTEVTQALWKAVMGSNPSRFKGDNLPVEQVSWEDCQEFICKLNQLTGKRFRLPTEAEWEYAARGGKKSRGYKYSGSNNIDNVAWYTNTTNDSGTKPVATKSPNELGLYDMSGNVYEWCSDWYSSYGSSSQTNPTGPTSGSYRVIRGCSWLYNARFCRVSIRNSSTPSLRNGLIGFRLALDPQDPNEQENVTTNQNSNQYELEKKTFTVKGVSFTMVKVEGGTFTMGGTSEQGSDAYDDEKPTHRVTLSSYSIGQTEVTQALWKAVMGSNPSDNKGDNLPVEQVSWEDCQEFIRKLNQLTGKRFRLPTEAEWEYAARGGKKSQGYKYSGSNNIDNVAWYTKTTNGSGTKPVATKSPNELGLYDISGNVYEWCSDWYSSYGSSSQTNPTGPTSGSSRVHRGGCWRSNARNCRVSFRLSSNPSLHLYDVGFRLALSE